MLILRLTKFMQISIQHLQIKVNNALKGNIHYGPV